jgi:hypothetical protein
MSRGHIQVGDAREWPHNLQAVEKEPMRLPRLRIEPTLVDDTRHLGGSWQEISRYAQVIYSTT